eukprot:scaffold521_cov177-Ochromonas_danica.AAC.1
MKKKSSRLLSVMHIVNNLKKAFHNFAGHKAPEVKTKIALVWYVNASHSLASYLVDEVELSALLTQPVNEIIAIQAYIGGYPVKGSGIFEHRISKTDKRGRVKYDSIERCDLDDLGLAKVQFTYPCKELIITDTQHELMHSLSILISRYIEGVTGGKVSQMTLVSVFNSSWTPFFVTLKTLSLTALPAGELVDREQFIYPLGIAPQPPAFDQRSSFLPVGVYDEVGGLGLGVRSEEGFERRPTRLQSPLLRPASPVIAGRPLSPHLSTRASGLLDQILNPQQTTTTTTATRTFFPDDPNNHTATRLSFTATNNTTASSSLPMQLSDLQSQLPQLKITIEQSSKQKEEQEKQEEPKERPEERVARAVVAQVLGKKPRPRSAPSTKATGRRLSNAPAPTTAVIQLKVSTPSDRVLQGTESWHNRLPVEHVLAREAPDGSAKPLESFFPVRRPISAPHNSRDKYKREKSETVLTQTTKMMTHVSFHGDHQQQYQQQHYEGQHGEGDEEEAIPGTYLHKDLPLAGSVCYGDYCNFIQQLDEAMRAEGTMDDFASSPPAAPSPKGKKKSYHRSSNRSQQLAYFIRQHLREVAQRCQEEARRMALSSTTHSAMEMWQDLHVVYRRLVYAQAMHTIHPSRFYYSVPVCKACYQLYTYADALRQKMILHPRNEEQAEEYLKMQQLEQQQEEEFRRKAHVDKNDLGGGGRKTRTVSRSGTGNSSLFHRLCYGDDEQPRSAGSTGGSKMRLMRLLQQQHQQIAQLKAQRKTIGQVDESNYDEVDDEEGDRRRDRKGRATSRSRSRSRHGADSSPSPLSAQPTSLLTTTTTTTRNIVQDNAEAVQTGSQRPATSTIFSYVKQQQQQSKKTRTVGGDQEEDVSVRDDEIEQEAMRNMMSFGVVQQRVNDRIANLYGYSTLPFEDDAPQLSVKGPTPTPTPALTLPLPAAKAIPPTPPSSVAMNKNQSATIVPMVRIDLTDSSRPVEIRLDSARAASPSALPVIAEESVGQLDEFTISAPSSLLPMDYSQSLSPMPSFSPM